MSIKLLKVFLTCGATFSANWNAYAICVDLQAALTHDQAPNAEFPQHEFSGLYKLPVGHFLYRYVSVSVNSKTNISSLVNFIEARDGTASQRSLQSKDLIAKGGYPKLATQQAFVGYKRDVPRLTIPAAETSENHFFAGRRFGNGNNPELKLLAKIVVSPGQPILSWRKTNSSESVEVGMLDAPRPDSVEWFLVVHGESNRETPELYRIENPSELFSEYEKRAEGMGMKAEEKMPEWAMAQVERGNLSASQPANLKLDVDIRLSKIIPYLYFPDTELPRVNKMLDYLADQVPFITGNARNKEIKQTINIILEGLAEFKIKLSRELKANAEVTQKYELVTLLFQRLYEE